MQANKDKAQHDFIKLLICLQASVELMDELEGTNLYRQEIKQVLNKTNKVLTSKINTVYRFIDDEEKEETFRSIDRAIHSILDTSLETLFAEGYLPQTNTQ